MTDNRKAGRPKGRKLSVVKSLALDPETAEILRTSARYACMAESQWIRRLIRANAIVCRVCGFDACVCGKEKARGQDGVSV